jgi:hypothetical protein
MRSGAESAFGSLHIEPFNEIGDLVPDIVAFLITSAFEAFRLLAR